MALSDIGTWLLGNTAFREQMDLLIADSVCSDIGEVLHRHLLTNDAQHDWRYLLLAGSALAVRPEGDCQSAALRIAQTCLATSGMTESRRDTAALILDSLANHPALELAVRRGLIKPEMQKRLPGAARIEWVRRFLDYSIESNGQALRVNRFQQRFWHEANLHQWLSVSAPTSAGKSFIVTRWIATFISVEKPRVIVYIVPTRALIGQVEDDLKRLFKSQNISVNVSSVPSARSLDAYRPNVLVFTQERLQIVLGSLENFKADALVVDEAHKVGDKQRGVLLQHVIERIVSNNSAVKIIFASPMTSNPEALLTEAAPDVTTFAFTSEDITVGQNLLWISQVPRKPLQWKAILSLPEHQISLGEITLPALPSPDSKRLPFVAYAIGGQGQGNIVYVNTAAEAEKIATQLYDLAAKAHFEANEDISALINLSERVVHRQFLLGKVLKRRIAFHYGNLPLLIRAEIERLFSNGVIRFLVCTSTLVEGVNMACRNIFLRGPEKGHGNPMSPEDFWNLAGRAGRWGKEFQGNIFCVDAFNERIWGSAGAPSARARYSIKRTSDTVLANPKPLLDFIEAGSPLTEARKFPELEAVFSYLVGLQLRYGSLRKAPWAMKYTTAQLADVEFAISAAIANLKTPAWVVSRNPGISPLSMDRLLAYFRERDKPVEELLPVDPASEDAPAVYAAIFGRLATRISPKLGPPPKRSYMLGLLVVRWMRGFQLSRLIVDRLKLNKGRNTDITIAATIRSVMEDVEQIVRFEAPKGIACYRDLLQAHLADIGKSELLRGLPDLGLLLEYGVSQQTQISLIGAGLSRTSAIALSEIIAADGLSETEVKEWLRANQRIWSESDMPVLVKQEVQSIIGS